jgi:hypothetical protein
LTHNDLLALIEDDIEVCSPDCSKHQRSNAPWAALRAVVGLHRPNLLSGTLTLVCIECHSVKDCSTCNATNNAHDWHYALYPCLTIQAIERELT